MKIAFLCSSIEPGRDGVGDYTRQLAAACASEGHTCQLLGLNERSASDRSDPNRFSATLPWAERAHRLAAALEAFEPDWVSWQFVSYGFHPKGITPPGAFMLADATRRWPRHVMLHELWIGIARGEPLKAKLTGAVQRFRLRAFLRHVRPILTHTSNPSYQIALRGLGWEARQLPLFGNIPITAFAQPLVNDALAAALGETPPADRWVAVTFGTLHSEWDADATLRWFLSAAKSAGRRPILIALGRAGAHGEKMLARLGRTFPEVRIVVTGPQSAERISHLMHAADFGIAAHPWALIGKSGSATAMAEHGLPVLVPRDDWQLTSGDTPDSTPGPSFARIRDVSPDRAAGWIQARHPPGSRLPAIATQFISDLSGISARRPIAA